MRRLIFTSLVCIWSATLLSAPLASVAEKTPRPLKAIRFAPPRSQVEPLLERPLIFYSEDAPTPPEWLRQWERRTGGRVEQRAFFPQKKNWPLDGDVYSVSPRIFAQLKEKLTLAEFEEDASLKTMNPAFGGHPFDIDNRWTRPWRWTPYFFMTSQKTGEPPPESSPVPQEWWEKENALWPDDLDLLTALRLKEKGLSANAPQPHQRRSIRRQLEDDLPLAYAGRCWEKLCNKDIALTFLPAFFFLYHPPPAIQCRPPKSKGTLVQLHLLMISEKSARTDWARHLVEFLLEPEQQANLLKQTGFFPTHFKKVPSPRNIPQAERWFAHSEFLFTSE